MPVFRQASFEYSDLVPGSVASRQIRAGVFDEVQAVGVLLMYRLVTAASAA
jgi:hypothetical protein